MRVAVLGAGVVGATCAYYLARDGHEVTLIDRQDGAGLETSFANAGHLCRHTARPWAHPRVIRMILREFGRPDAPFLLRLRADPAMWIWALRFLRNCNLASYRRVSTNLQRLSVYSHDSMTDLVESLDLDYDRLGEGILHLFLDQKAFDEAAAGEREGDDARGLQVLDRAACLSVEPALADSELDVAGGFYFGREWTGDAYKFSKAIAAASDQIGVVCRFGESVETLRRDGDAVTAVVTDKGEIDVDAVVISLGSYSPILLRRIGVRVPIYPLKGYSITVPTDGYNGAPRIGIQDETRRIGLSRLGNRLRVAGTAELTGYDTRMRPERAEAIRRAAKALFPNGGDYDQAELWTGLRPMTPDCAPILGHASLRNVVLNTGHGSLGWTLACGSAAVATDLVAGRDPGIDLDGLTLARFTGG